MEILIRRRNKFKLIDAAIALMCEKGYHHMTVDDILEKSGVKKSNFYYHYESKEACAMAAFDAMLEKVDDEIWQRILNNKSLSPKERLEHLAEFLVKQFESGGGKTGDVFGNLTAELADQHSFFQEKLNDYFIRYASYLEGVIQEGIEEDEFRQSIIPREAAEAILSQIQGAYLLARAYQDPAALRRNIDFLINILSA